MAEPAPKKKKSVFWRAFSHQYNVIFLGAAGLFGLATFSWVPLLLGAGAEALWMVLGADSQAFRRWSAIQDGLEAQAAAEKEAETALENLDARYQDRYQALRARARHIQELAGANTTFEGALVEQEMAKLGKALQSFVRMAVLHQRLGVFLSQNDPAEAERDIARCQRDLQRERDPEVQATLRQSLALAQKRLQQQNKIIASFKVITLKMDTLEKSLAYLESRVVAMGRREELTSEIQDIVLGVESVDEFSLETSGLLADASPSRAARAAQGQQSRN